METSWVYNLHCSIGSGSGQTPRSVWNNGRILRLTRVDMNHLVLSAMTSNCISQFHGLHQKVSVQLSAIENYSGNARTCFHDTSQVTSSKIPPILSLPSLLVSATHLTPSDIPQRSEEWFVLRKDKLTTSTFSTALGFWKGNRRYELWHQKVFTPDADSIVAAAKAAMEWGMVNEATAIEQYKGITGRDVSSLGFAVHAEEQFGWMGASPDGLLGCCPGGGILEVKCPYNKGKPQFALPWSTMPFYYMPQVQGQMEIMDREWVDLYCWTQNGSTIFRVSRERTYWELMYSILREFWWENVVPAREAFLLGSEEDARAYKPTSTHRQTGLVIAKSMKLAAEAKLLCREIAGHIEFHR